MNLTAIMPARSEAWIIGLSARVALLWCDNLVVLDHASEDDTQLIVNQIASEHPGRVFVMSEPLAQWDEMDHRQRLLDFARGIGSTHVAPVDADEVLAGDMLPKIRTQIERLPPGQFCSAKMRNLHNGIGEFRSDNSPFGSMAGTMLAFADAPQLRWQALGGVSAPPALPDGLPSRPDAAGWRDYASAICGLAPPDGKTSTLQVHGAAEVPE